MGHSMTSEKILSASECSARAIELMAEHGVAPVPENYALWYRYASGQTPDLNQALDKRVSDGLPIDPAAVDELRERYLNDAKLTAVTLDTGEKLNSELNQIIEIIESSSGNSTAFGHSVREASAGLSAKSTPTDVRNAVKSILEASRDMEARSQELEERLKATSSEVTELQQTLEAARSEARTDALTGVANRKAFDETLSREISQARESGQPLCLLIGDIDHFKKFNDTFGHRTGDQVLRLVASCLNNGTRQSDMVARYGGEEFGVVLPSTTTEEAEQIANKIREAVQSRELVKRSTGESLGRVTMSLGVGSFRPSDESASLIERADACLYEAKRNGRNQVRSELSAPAGAPAGTPARAPATARAMAG